MADKKTMEEKRSAVRVYVTYFAALFLFLGGALFITALLVKGQLPLAKDLFMTILPVSAAIVSYWFAGRKPNSPSKKTEPQGDDDGNAN